MDDELEAPSSQLHAEKVDVAQDDNNAEHFSDDDDGGPDWTKMPVASSSSARPVIPKRGEKDFEPKAGSNLQQHLLERMRTAMFNALDVERTISSKAASYGIWVPSLSRAHVTVARGTLFTTMGYSVPRPVAIDTANAPVGTLHDSRQIKVMKRLELLPEETLYLVERGSMFCWKDEEDGAIKPKGVDGTPMTVQQAYAEIIGKGGLTLERYQVYAYLKRLGFVVTRTQPPDDHYPVPPPQSLRISTEASRSNSPLVRILARIRRWMSSLCRVTTNWMKPISFGWPLHRFPTYSSIFSALRLVPSGHSLPLYAAKPVPGDTPYKIFYNLYKPNTTFKKSSPPQPDFSVVVVDARTTPMPTLNELTALFDILPESALPLTRRQKLNSMNKSSAASNKSSRDPPRDDAASSPSISESRLAALMTWLRRIFIKTKNTDERPPQRPNPFAVLKAGKKMVVIAAVDAGMISFFRLGPGEFPEWPMV